MKAFVVRFKTKSPFRRSVPAARIDQAGRARCMQRVQIRQILDSPRPQFKLTIGAPNDVYEQEADRVADEVMRMPDPTPGGEWVQRMCPECEEELHRQPVEEPEEEELQRQSVAESEEEMEDLGEPVQTLQTKSEPGGGDVLDSGVASQINSLRGGGRPLSNSTRRLFEPRFGHDFADVRIHDDSRAATLARTVGARAFTLGTDVVFAPGEYPPEVSAGRRILAHELTHVVQQRASAPSKALGPTGAESRHEATLGVLQRQGNDLAITKIAEPRALYLIKERVYHKIGLPGAYPSLVQVSRSVVQLHAVWEPAGGKPSTWQVIKDYLGIEKIKKKYTGEHGWVIVYSGWRNFVEVGGSRVEVPAPGLMMFGKDPIPGVQLYGGTMKFESRGGEEAPTATMLYDGTTNTLHPVPKGEEPLLDYPGAKSLPGPVMAE
jgi:hypothetical protein